MCVAMERRENGQTKWQLFSRPQINCAGAAASIEPQLRRERKKRERDGYHSLIAVVYLEIFSKSFIHVFLKRDLVFWLCF